MVFHALFAFATAPEAAPLCARLGLEVGCDQEIETSHHGTMRISVLLTGMGPTRASQSLAVSLAAARPDCVINAGIAGALSPALTVGKVVRISAVAAVDVEPPTSSQWQRMDTNVVPWLQRDLPRATLVTRATPLFDAAVRARLAGTCDAVDMEGAAVAALCEAARVPCVLLKSMSDHATDRAELHRNLACASERLAEVIAFCIGEYQPRRLPA